MIRVGCYCTASSILCLALLAIAFRLSENFDRQLISV